MLIDNSLGKYHREVQYPRLEDINLGFLQLPFYIIAVPQYFLRRSRCFGIHKIETIWILGNQEFLQPLWLARVR